MLHQLSKCFSTAHLSLDVLIHKGYMPFKIDGYHIGWVSPQAWVALAQFKHIFQLNNGSVNISVITHDIKKRNHFISQVLNILAKKQWLMPLINQTFDVVSPLNQTLCSLDVSGALFFGLELPVISLTAFFKHEGEYFYWVLQEAHQSFNILFQEVLYTNNNISNILNTACSNFGISMGVAHTIGSIATKRLIKEGLLRCRMQNYLIEVPNDINLSYYNKNCKLLSSSDLVHILSISNSFSIEASIILADILQKHGIVEILPNGVRII